MALMSSGVIKTTSGNPKKNPFSSINQLSQHLRMYGFTVHGFGKSSQGGTSVKLWGPRKE